MHTRRSSLRCQCRIWLEDRAAAALLPRQRSSRPDGCRGCSPHLQTAPLKDSLKYDSRLESKRLGGRGVSGVVSQRRLTRVGPHNGSRPFALQNKTARRVRLARWSATVCCAAAAMSFTHDKSVPFSTPAEAGMIFPVTQIPKSSVRLCVARVSVPSSASSLAIVVVTWFRNPAKEKQQSYVCAMGVVKWNLFLSPPWASSSMAWPPLRVEHWGWVMSDRRLAIWHNTRTRVISVKVHIWLWSRLSLSLFA